jgi:hypothetical protein
MKEFINKEDLDLIIEFIFDKLKQTLKEENISKKTPLYIEHDYNSCVLDIENIHKTYSHTRVVSIINRGGINHSSFIVMRNSLTGVHGNNILNVRDGATFAITRLHNDEFCISVLDHYYHNDRLFNRDKDDIIRPEKNYYPDMINKVPVSKITINPNHLEYYYIESMFNKFYSKAIDLISSTNEKRHNAAISFIKEFKQ